MGLPWRKGMYMKDRIISWMIIIVIILIMGALLWRGLTIIGG